MDEIKIKYRDVFDIVYNEKDNEWRCTNVKNLYERSLKGIKQSIDKYFDKNFTPYHALYINFNDDECIKRNKIVLVIGYNENDKIFHVIKNKYIYDIGDDYIFKLDMNLHKLLEENDKCKKRMKEISEEVNKYLVNNN